MFSNSGEKLRELANDAEKSIESGDQNLMQEKYVKALRFMYEHEKETSQEFLGAQLFLASALVHVGDPGKGGEIFRGLIERMEELGRERTCLYAMVCMYDANFLRMFTSGLEQVAREILEKGLRRALEGDRDELMELSEHIDEYLDEIAQFKLESWISGFYKKAAAAFESKVGADELATAVMLHAFAEAMRDSNSVEDQAQALEAADRALRIAVQKKWDPDEVMQLAISKANVLDAVGRIAEAAEQLRAAINQIKCASRVEAALCLANNEIYLECDPAQIEAALDRTVGSVKTLGPQYQIITFGMKGYLAALRGDEAAVMAFAAAIENFRGQKPEAENVPIEQYMVDELNRLVCGLVRAGRIEAALKMADRAIQSARTVEGPFPSLLEDALTIKAVILTRLGRAEEAEALLYDEVLEKLDDINELDTDRHAKALIDLAMACIEKSEYERAREILKNAWAMSAEHEGKTSIMAGKIYVAMGKLLMRMNQPDKGREALRRGRDTLKARGELDFQSRAVLQEYAC